MEIALDACECQQDRVGAGHDGVAKGKTTAEAREKTLGNLSGATSFDALKDCDLVVEAIVEHLDQKKAMFEEFREPAYAPPPLLKRMVLAGRLGRKSGHGFYQYRG